MAMSMVPGLTLMVMILLLYAAAHDLLARTVPNWTSGSIALLALVARLIAGDLEASLLFGLGVFAILLSFWCLRLFGGGDVKLWAAATLSIPPSWPNEWSTFSRVVLIGGIIALIYILLHYLARIVPVSLQHHGKPALWRRGLRSEIWRIRRGGSVPYAVAICSGFLAALWSVS